jgi:DNA adenine methylase
MRYMGGKVCCAKRISEKILSMRGSRQTYVEPFLGAASVFIKLAPHFRDVQGSDIHPDLILMLQALQKGWEPPTEMPKEIWDSLRYAEPSALRGFAGFGCSFSGAWFSSYALQSPKGHNKLPALETHDTLMKIADKINFPIGCFSYEKYHGTPDMVIYADPPYVSTYGLKQCKNFDTDKFWSVANRWVDEGAQVFVTEKIAPDPWISVLDIERHLVMNAKVNQAYKISSEKVTRTYVERLYTRS